MHSTRPNSAPSNLLRRLQRTNFDWEMYSQLRHQYAAGARVQQYTLLQSIVHPQPRWTETSQQHTCTSQGRRLATSTSATSKQERRKKKKGDGYNKKQLLQLHQLLQLQLQPLQQLLQPTTTTKGQKQMKRPHQELRRQQQGQEQPEGRQKQQR